MNTNGTDNAVTTATCWMERCTGAAAFSITYDSPFDEDPATLLVCGHHNAMLLVDDGITVTGGHML